MELKTFIDYYNTCAICDGDMIINADLSIPSTIDREEDGLLLSVYEEGKTPTEFKLLYSNKIESTAPYIMSTPYTKLRRHLENVPADAYDKLQLEVSCIQCGKFKYWSNNIIFDHVAKTIGHISIRTERAELKLDNEQITLSNDLKKEELKVYSPGSRNFRTIPFIGTLKGLPLRETEWLMLHIKKQLIVS